MTTVDTNPDPSDDLITSRSSPGIFGYIHTFQATLFLALLSVALPFGTGFLSMILTYFATGILNWMLFIRDAAMFTAITICGTFACMLFRDRTPLFTWRLAYLINAYGTVMFALSYIFGHFLEFILGALQFVEIFFIIGALVAYIVLFVVYFSFTRVGTPFNILLALVQPVAGILLYSFVSEQLELVFFLKAVVFFVVSASIFALGYGPAMAKVSLPYRRKTGVGGYNFIRAFVEALLLEDNDAAIEDYFNDFSEERPLILQYLALREQQKISKSNASAKDIPPELKSLLVIPNVHFGPFKTAGSAALAEKIYQSFDTIPGMTVYHTTTTHGDNFSRHDYNAQVIHQIKEDMQKFQFQPVKARKFIRILHEKTKILGTTINGSVLLFLTRHPYPTDDIVPAIGEKIKAVGEKFGFKSIFVIDCHNSLTGDEILIEEDTEECKEILQSAEIFFKRLSETPEPETESVLYGVAREKISEYPISAGVGAGGIIAHYFKIEEQQTVLIHVDANNAQTPVRSALVNLSENMGIDRFELTTSDTHAVVRILSAQGYFPLGGKINSSFLVNKVKQLIERARTNASLIESANTMSSSSHYRFWKDLSFFEIILETIERSVSVSKILLTVGMVIPVLLSLIMVLFFF